MGGQIMIKVKEPKCNCGNINLSEIFRAETSSGEVLVSYLCGYCNKVIVIDYPKQTI